LLVFGKEAKTRIWMVWDGKSLHVDRNGNGDLTDPGERISAASGMYYHVNRLVERDGTVHQNLQLFGRGDGTFTLQLGEEGARAQYVGMGLMTRPTWGNRPANAPIIHFNGPMTLERYGPVYNLPRMTVNGSNSRRYKLRLLLGTPGLGTGTFASYDEVCSENLGPLQADIEYAADPQGRSLNQSIDLVHDG